MKQLLIPLALAFPMLTCAQANCDQISVGLTPIMDLGLGTYNGMTGGLYGDGTNQMPAAHLSAGLSLAQAVQPLDASGAPDAALGKVVLLSIGMSNTQQESQAFIDLVNSSTGIHPSLTVVNGGVGGQTAAVISSPWSAGYQNYWSTVSDRLEQAGATAQQVQAIWLKEANVANGQAIETYRDSLAVQFRRILHEFHARFPNARLCYLSSRTYGGYATTGLNPEPYAYEQGWVVQELILDQISGDPGIAWDGPSTSSPWIAWGPYLWADGTTPRSDGFTWDCPADVQTDGTHPSTTGRTKIAGLLFDFFSTDPTTCPWFMAACATPVMAHVSPTIAFWPNPSSGIVHFDTGVAGPQAAHLEVVDAWGRLIATVAIEPGQRSVDLSALASGIYLLRHGMLGRVARIALDPL
ncbi:MAG: T9SS type A sorting domain-containing protein [Flavobacteriales bacterium]|nr:T9SS type A sorting domain-containing protein [Flavobacteriales bacterium]